LNRIHNLWRDKREREKEKILIAEKKRMTQASLAIFIVVLFSLFCIFIDFFLFTFRKLGDNERTFK
jgi:hypothetical protein